MVIFNSYDFLTNIAKAQTKLLELIKKNKLKAIMGLINIILFTLVKSIRKKNYAPLKDSQANTHLAIATAGDKKIVMF